ncbi:MAG: translation initiation factor [Caldilineaceae bacterium]|nr:translation initiation factor [Caldilineaceae bacterium]
MSKRKARNSDRSFSRKPGPRLVYSTDPEPEPERRPPEMPRNPAAPFAVQGTQPVRVRLERKGRKGKTVSIITGVKSPEVGKRGLLKHLKGKLGCGGAVKGAEIEIQGDQRERLVALLNELGYRARQG